MFSDDDVRRELRRLIDDDLPTRRAPEALQELRPAFRRARRRRRARFSASALLLVGGTVATARLLPPDRQDTIVSTSPDLAIDPTLVTSSSSERATGDDDVAEHPADDPADDLAGDSPDGSLVVGDITPSRLESVRIESDGSTGETTTSTVEAVTVSTSTGGPSVVAPAPTTTTQPPTTTSPSTTAPASPTSRAAQAPTDQDIVTRCGNASVEFDGDVVVVTATSPAPGYIAVVHDDHHSKIEIKFSSDTDEDCEVHVKADGSIEVSESGT